MEYIYDGVWKNDNFLGKPDNGQIWVMNESFEEYRGQWSRGFRDGQGELRKVQSI